MVSMLQNTDFKEVEKMLIEFPVMGGVVAVNSDRVTHVQQSHYAPFEKAIICFDERSVEVHVGIDEVIKRLNNADKLLMTRVKNPEVL